MKLFIQIPCLNEAGQLPETLADLPRSVEGFDSVEWLVIDDGSTDDTAAVALECGVDHLVRLRQNRGLAAAFQAGLDACLKLGADVIVNTDADNQYDARSIPDLVRPILDRSADVVIGTRYGDGVAEFSPTKQRLQRFGSRIVSRASGTEVPDATSGFRAYSRKAALELFVVNNFTYTLESVIQAGQRRAAVANVPVATNPKRRESRLFRSIPSYIRRSIATITRVLVAYEPMRFFGCIAGMFFVASAVASVPLFYDWIVNGDRSGHMLSIMTSAALFIGGMQMLVLGVVADLTAGNRTVLRETLERIRLIELHIGTPPVEEMTHRIPPAETPDTTGAPTYRSEHAS